jgi:hypothetical protein
MAADVRFALRMLANPGFVTIAVKSAALAFPI